MNLSYADAKALGLEHLWPSRMDVISEQSMPAVLAPEEKEPAMNRLESAFWGCLQRAPYKRVYHEPFKLRLAGRTFYRVDFAAVDANGVWSLFETKGYMRDDASVKIKVAASLYPGFVFWLVHRPKKIWTMRAVTCNGISRHVWTPDWLR